MRMSRSSSPPDTLLDTNRQSQIEDILTAAIPTGQTPLYYALELALGEFDEIRMGYSARHLVVVTDRENWQPLQDGPAEVIRGKSQFERLRKSRRYEDVRVHYLQVGPIRYNSAQGGFGTLGLARRRSSLQSHPRGRNCDERRCRLAGNQEFDVLRHPRRLADPTRVGVIR